MEKGGDEGGSPREKIYCLDYNKGSCVFPGSHEGRFNRMNVIKTHMCKVCWEKDGVERKHPEGCMDCAHKRV